MEIHHRFMKISTTGINLLLDSVGDNYEATIARLVNDNSEKIHDGVADVKTLEGLRAILCHQYQSLINSKKSLSESSNSFNTDIKSFFVRSTESWSNEQLSLLYDILVLRFVLRSNAQHFAESFKKFYETQDLQQSNEKCNIHMRVSECFADCHNLRLYLHKESCDKLELELQRTFTETAIKSWLQQEGNLEWRLLASLLPKLAMAFGYDNIVSPLWNEVFDKFNNDLEKTLASLCVMADVCFPSENEMVNEIHYEQCVQKEFWSIVQEGLLSGVFQHRKQALYLAKRAVDFVGSHEPAIKIKLQQIHENIVPFVCTRLPLADLSIEKMKKSFFMLLEVLEEKQKHLVLPALSYLPNLLEAYNDHLSCGDCFNVVWLHCVFKRILQHDNDEIKIMGLEVILQADLGIFDDSFLNFIATILNNTFLYDYDRLEELHPRIVKLLLTFFQRAEEASVPLINAFLHAISKVSWGPVALYWVLQSVLHINVDGPIDYNIWTTKRLKSIAILVPKIVTMSCLPLRTVSLYLVLTAIPKYIQGPLSQSDFEIMINTQSVCLAIFLQSSSPIEWKCSMVNSLKIKSSEAALYITKTCNTFFSSERDIETLALNIVLLLSSMPSKGEDIVTATKAVHCLLQNLNDANNRLYADPVTIFKVFKFASHLIHNMCNLMRKKYELGRGCDDERNMIKDIVSPYRTTIIELLNRSLERNKTGRYDEYLLTLKVLIDMHSPANSELSDIWWANMEKHFEVFEDKCIAYTAEIFSNANYDLCSKNQLSYVLKVLYLCRERTCSRRPLLETLYVPRLLLLLDNESRRNFDFTFETIVKIMRQFITKLPPKVWPTNIRWIEKIQSLVEIGREEMIESIAAMLYELLEKNPSLVIEDLSTVHLIIRQSWRCAFQMRRDKDFFSAITQLTRLIVNSKYLILDGAKEYAIEFVTEILIEGDRVPKLKRIFLASIKTLGPKEVLEFHKSLVSCLLHGAVPRRDQRIEQIAIRETAFILDCTDELVIGIIDKRIRAEAIIVLLRIMTSPEATEVRSFIFVELLRILEQNKNKRYFDNSQLHRLKHRVMQTLLILEPFLSIPERKNLHDDISGLLIAESNQPSVRLMQEWILSRIYINDNSMRELIWDLFATAGEKRPGSIVSLAGIVYHVSQSLLGETRSSYITKAIQHLLPNCMGQHFNVRLYSQEILGRLYKMAPVSSDCRQIYEGIEKSYLETVKKSSIRVFDNFYFTNFDPIASYTFENIYFELPRLTNVCDTEWIDPVLFKGLEMEQVIGIEPMLVEYGELRAANPMLKSTKATGELAEDTEPLSDKGLNDIQKKIIPWKSMVPFYDDLSEAAKATLSRRKMQNDEAGIIVVASLIDRPPNLGGLARTCEIFGAKELVIGSLRYAENGEFRALSVSAEKWITITEVKPHLLKNYFLEKQSEGWNLVGAEQTANSVNLLEMKFDKKTILLLGNEKDGIPASLIPLLDKCVEIPQNGVVRSLNVHVTGAICIWQYAKQHILT